MSEIVVSREGRVNVVRFNRAEKKNAITRSMYAALAAAVLETDNDGDLRATLFVGQPDVFTSGNDLADFMAANAGGEKGTEVVDFLTALIQSKKPLLAAVDGLAVGVGTTMLMHCDMVFASPRAWFKTPFVDLGLVSEAGSSLVGPRIMGQREAFALLVAGEKFSAERAAACGLVNDVVPGDDLENRALEAAALLAEKPVEALRLTRDMVRGDQAAIMERMVHEGHLFAERLLSDEAREAFMAFMSKSKAA